MERFGSCHAASMMTLRQPTQWLLSRSGRRIGDWQRAGGCFSRAPDGLMLAVPSSKFAARAHRAAFSNVNRRGQKGGFCSTPQAVFPTVWTISEAVTGDGKNSPMPSVCS